MTPSTKQSIAGLFGELDLQLNSRDSLFPSRDAGNDERIRQLLADFVQAVNFLAAAAVPGYPVPDTSRGSDFAEQGVFLCGYMKCGTTLLLELLDGHPEMVVLPGDSWFMGRRILGHEDGANIYKQDLVDRWIARLVNPTGQAPFWLLGKKIEPYLQFLQCYLVWHRILADEPQRGHLMSVLLAYASVTQADLVKARWWVEKTPGNEFSIDRILNYFPQAKFIHITRDPRENFASLKRLYSTRKWEWNPFSVAGKIGESCRTAVVNQKRLGEDRYHVLSYEELTKNPKRCMEAVRIFLDISWHDCLLQPTVNSIPAQANTMYGDRKVTGAVRRTSSCKWQSVLSATEKRAILCIRKNAEKAGYKWHVSTLDYLLNTIARIKYRLATPGGPTDE